MVLKTKSCNLLTVASRSSPRAAILNAGAKRDLRCAGTMWACVVQGTLGSFWQVDGEALSEKKRESCHGSQGVRQQRSEVRRDGSSERESFSGWAPSRDLNTGAQGIGDQNRTQSQNRENMKYRAVSSCRWGRESPVVCRYRGGGGFGLQAVRR